MAKLYILEGPMEGQVFEFKGKNVFIGRSSRSDIKLDDMMVSRKHLKIFRTAKAFYIEDLGSTNGTLLNGEAVTPGETYKLNENDTIVIGKSTLQLAEIAPLKVPNYQPSASSMGQSGGYGNSGRERRSRSTKNLQLIYRASELLEQPLNINDLLGEILESIFDTFPRIDRASVLLFEKDKIKEVITKTRKGHAQGTPRYSRTILVRVAQNGKPVKVSNTTYETHPENTDHMDTLQIRSVMCTPMVINTKVGGAIYVDSPQGPHDGSRKEDLLLLNTLGKFVAAALENAYLHPD